MFGKIAGFELRYQLKSPVFWVVATIFFLLTFGAATIDQIRIGGGGNIHKNAPFAIAQTHLILSIFYMFRCSWTLGAVAAAKALMAGVSPSWA